MKIRALLLTALISLSANVLSADEGSVVGKRIPPAAPEASQAFAPGSKVAVLKAIVSELRSIDVSTVTSFVDQLYTLKDLYLSAMQTERELRQTHISDEKQKELMKRYIQLLNDEKEQAKVVIDSLTRDLDAKESRLLQVMAKIFRIGDQSMKTTVLNVRQEVRKYLRFKMQNAGMDRPFYVDAMRFLDQYFRF
jgi:flagellar motor component MotA